MGMVPSASSASGAIKRAESTRNGWECSKIFTRRTVAEDRVTKLEPSKVDGSYADHINKITVTRSQRKDHSVVGNGSASGGRRHAGALPSDGDNANADSVWDRRANGAPRTRSRLSPAYGAGGIPDNPGRRPASTAETPRSRRTLPLPHLVGKALAKHSAEFPQVEDGSLSTRPTATGTGSSSAAPRIFAPAVRNAGLPAGTTSHALVNR
jgi:hypothetical protein